MDMQTAYAGYGARKVWHKEDRMRLSLPLYSLGEEIFSAVSHGVGALFGAAALFGIFVTLVLAGLCAEHKTVVENCHFIRRGYEDIVRDFRELGADIGTETEI